MCNNWWIGGCAILYEALHTLTINFLRKSMNFSKNKILWKINPQIEENLLCLNPGDYRAQCTMLGNLLMQGRFPSLIPQPLFLGWEEGGLGHNEDF